MVNPDNKVKFDPSDDSNYVSEDEDVKPVTAPQPTNKDFKKVFGKMRKDGKEGDEMFGKKKSADKMVGEEAGAFAAVSEKMSKTDEETAAEDVPAAPMSLFDLSKGSQVKDEHVARSAVKPATPVHAAATESPSDLFKRMAKPVKATKEPPHDTAAIAASEDVPAVKPRESKKDNFTTRYTPEQTDLSYVNPLAANAPAQPITNIVSETKSIERTAAVMSPSMQELIDHIVKTMYTVEKSDQTDTIVTLQHPPLFKGANIVITAYDSARGQFNLSFENLTQSAKRILDLSDNRQALILALEQKGYGVQIVQTTTLVEHTVPVAHSEPGRGGREQDRGGQQQKQQHRDRG